MAYCYHISPSAYTQIVEPSDRWTLSQIIIRSEGDLQAIFFFLQIILAIERKEFSIKSWPFWPTQLTDYFLCAETVDTIPNINIKVSPRAYDNTLWNNLLVHLPYLESIHYKSIGFKNIVNQLPLLSELKKKLIFDNYEEVEKGTD
jgi:hypothetical protein